VSDLLDLDFFFLFLKILIYLLKICKENPTVILFVLAYKFLMTSKVD